MILWRIGREDLRPLLLITLLPLLVAAPLLLGVLNANPALYTAEMTIDAHGSAVSGFQGLLPGQPVIDGDNGVTTQALGRLAAVELIHGHMPWWNSYTGVGLPLAAEYQPAAFFPPTLLLLLPQGTVLEHLLLQILAGWGTYALLRQLGLGRLAALAGGVLFAFDGTLALWGSANILPLPFLPWMLFGIERAQVKAMLGLRGGWRLFALAMALSLLGGFPEEAYLNGLLALAWAGLRLIQTPPDKRLAFTWRIGLGGVLGVALAAPQIFAFFESLPNAYLWIHGSTLMEHAKLPIAEIAPSLISPFVFGLPYGYAHIWSGAFKYWGGIGGYVTASIVIIAAYGVLARRSPLGWLLLGWTVLALGKMFGLPPAVFLWNLAPGVSVSVLVKYIQPTWVLALVVLAAFGLDDLVRSGPRRAPLLGAASAALLIVGYCVVFGAHIWSSVHAIPGLRSWLVISLIWASLAALACVGLLAIRPSRWTAPAVAMLLMGESMVMFAIPTLCNPPRGTNVDMPAVEFLRRNLGFSRFYTLGPIAPNYGAYYGIASINHSYLPGSLLWVQYIQAHLDRGASGVNFGGDMMRQPMQPGAAQALLRNLPAFEWVGVKYVVTKANTPPTDDGPIQPAAPESVGSPSPTSRPHEPSGMRKVYADAVMDIFELPNPSPYFEILSGQCAVVAHDRNAATANCTTPTTLLRRELFYPGWRVRIDGRPTAITKYGDLFQAVSLPKGKSVIRFNYAPPHILWMWLLTWIAIASLTLSGLLEFRARRTASDGIS